MAKDCSRKTSDDSAAQLDGEFSCSRQVLPCFLRHGAESSFVTKFVHRKLPNSVRNLSVKVNTVYGRSNVHTELAEYR